MFIRIEHPHKCKCISRAPAMGSGRDWWIGKLIERVAQYPGETHCLHLRTNVKDVQFLCNEADFRNLIIICRAVVGQPSESWLQSMVDHSLLLAEKIVDT